MLNSIASFLGYIMNFIYEIVQNYGLAIILFTLLLKILLLPLTIKQQKSMKQTQELQPLVQELQRKYGNDQQKFQEEYQKLLKEKNLNMVSGSGCSGCLLQLIQIPIILAMFYMMASPLTNILKMDEARINELKAEVQEKKVQEQIAIINENAANYSDAELEELINTAKETDYLSGRYYEIEILKHTNIIDMNFLGINLCDITLQNKENISLWIIPILSALATLVMSKMNSKDINKAKSAAKTPDGEEIPMPDMRVMNMMMPIMTGYIALVVPQGVGLYWVTSNILGVIQQALLKKKLPNEKNDV